MNKAEEPGISLVKFDKEGLHISLRVSYYAVVAVLMLFYVCWEYYWYCNVGYKVIKWHTHLAVYGYIWLLGVSVIWLINKIKPLPAYRQYGLMLLSVCLTLMLAEGILYLTGIGATYTEQLHYGYTSPYATAGETHYRTRKPNDTFQFIRPEFTHTRTTNSLGFSDSEWPKPKPARQKRVLCLGDSFTEGIGAPTDSTYVSQLGNLLKQRDTCFYVMNAGTASNDPFVNFVNYRDHLWEYKPSIIVQTLSTNDVLTDILLRGGMQRFKTDGTLKYNPAPWWEPVYAVSNISRLLFRAMGYSELLVNNDIIAAHKSDIDNQLIDLFKEYNSLAEKNGSRLLLVFQPVSINVVEGRYDYDFTVVKTALSQLHSICVYDLLPFYLNYIKQSEQPIAAYYWKQDGHHNPQGYSMMAAGIDTAIALCNTTNTLEP